MFMKKRVILFIALVLLIPLAYAESTIFTGIVTTDSEISAEGNKFSFNYDKYSKKAFPTTPSTNLIIDYGACKSNDIFKVCINKANFSYRNITTYKSYYTLDITISKLTGSLSSSIKSPFLEYLQGERMNVTATLTNPTNLEITKINLELDLSNLSVIGVKGCEQFGNKARWNGSLKPNYDKECTISMVAPSNGGTFAISGKVNYFNGFEKEDKTIETLSFKVLPKQLKLTYLVDNTTDFTRIETGDSFHYNVTIENIHASETIGASASITYPPNTVPVKNLQGFLKDGNVFKKNIVLKPGQAFSYQLYLKATHKGVGRLVNSFKYTIKEMEFDDESSQFIEITEPKPVVELIPEYNSIVPGQKFIVVAKISNPSRKYDFTGITSRLDVPFNAEISQQIDKLAPNQSYVMISRVFSLPYDSELQNNELKISFQTDYNLNDIPKSAQSSTSIKVNNIEFDKSANETATEPVAEPEINPEFNASLSQETSSESSTEPAAQPDSAQSLLDSSISVDFSKPDFSSPKIWIIASTVFVILFLIPFFIYRIRKKKQAVQPPLQPQPPSPPQV